MPVVVRYLGGSLEVFIPDAGASVARGGTVEVPDDVAGHEPSGDDPGVGLLAQVDVWARAESLEG
jgi:hypothetical protein